MTPRVKPDYVGTEEDPTCVICQQLLYLSAVSCNCRPSTYVCLEHWENLCECKRNKLRLLYRHSLAELSGLLVSVHKYNAVEAAGESRKDMCSEKVVALAKKVKGHHVTHLQLAEEWILKSCKILELPYSKHAYASAIEEAEQFLWAGSEMDLVREIENNLIQAKNWAKAVKDCFSKVKSWSNSRNCKTERVQMDRINELLNLKTAPCNEPSHLQLKEYQEDANILIQEINTSLSSSEYSVSDLEILYSKVVDLPIYIKESEKLKLKLSAVKVWVDDVRNCISLKAPSLVEEDMLYKLELEMLDLHIQLPEVDLLANLIRQVKSCRSRCNEILKDPICLKEVKLLLNEWEAFTVNIPELKLLKKYYGDTISWISRVDLILMNVHEREDQENVVDELTSIKSDGLLLQIQVDELPRVELELDKAQCRVKAYTVLRSQMSMDFVQQLILEAAKLQIEKEKVFADISQRHVAAVDWEDKAKQVLATSACLSSFEDILRASEHIGIIPPSLLDVKLAVSTAKDWLIKAKPFLFQDSAIMSTSNSCLQVDVLKELVLESKDLKVHLEECSLLENILKKGMEWEQDASCLLQNAEQLRNINIIGEGSTSCLVPNLERQVLLIEAAMEAGISLGLEFNMTLKLQDACSMLKWCIKALSFSTSIPSHEEVEMMLDASSNLPVVFISCALSTALTDGLSWLKKSFEVLDPNSRRQFEISNVEELLALSKRLCISFPTFIGRLQNAIENHNLWIDQVHLFYGLSCEDRSWNMLLQLKEDGISNAFSCGELEKVLYEAEKVEKWNQRCADIIKPLPAEENPLLRALIDLKNSIERSFEVYSNSKLGESTNLCMCCFSSIDDCARLTCSICKDSFHLQCAERSLEDTVLSFCRYCNFINSSKLPRSGSGFLRTGRKHLTLDKLTFLLSESSDLFLWTDERRILSQIVEKALACNASLTKLVNFSLAYVSQDLNVVSQKMCIALKAMDVGRIGDDEGNRLFELALGRHSWKIKAKKLLGSGEKPTLQQIQHHLKEGLAMNTPPEDYFAQKLTVLRNTGLQWADTAKKVSGDGGVLGLDRVFELISEGESLPVSCAKEIKLLRDRSMLYCICRRPYDQKAMIACDKCDEWYHFDCIKISSAPKVYICPACNPGFEENTSAPARATHERFSGNKLEEPQTPLRRSELRRNSQKPKSSILAGVNDMNDCLRNISSTGSLLWRNKKPFRRAARKRSQLDCLSPFYYVRDKS
ncbi:hypothetical protein ABFX02_05G100200 [Erythranthe guttata]